MAKGRECCDNKGSIESIIVIKISDIKTLKPFKMKRKYGKFKRVAKKYSL